MSYSSGNDIIFGRLLKRRYGDAKRRWYVYSLLRYGGHDIMGAVYSGDNPPPARKTVTVMLVGYFEYSDQYGRQFFIKEWRNDMTPKMTAQRVDELLDIDFLYRFDLVEPPGWSS